MVTGAVVNSHVNLSRRKFDRLKAVIHACGKPGDTRLEDPGFQRRLMGQLDWACQVNPQRGAKLKHLLIKALGARSEG